ncbi:response regulator [Alsobacter sp. SYSU BS001988]
MTQPRVLILEDEFFVALDLEAIVQAHVPRAEIVLCTSVVEAQAALAKPIRVALLDVDVHDGKSFSVAEALVARGIPFAFVSASSPGAVPDALSHAPFVAKPYAAPLLQQTLSAMIGRVPHHD